jgi:two-component system response regulator YesN
VGAESERIWRELSAYIDENLGIRLTLTELPERCFYNPSYFSRIFKEKFGVSFVEYLTRKRLDCAIRMLTETNLTIDEISISVGFSDRSSMHHAFSKYLGQTPADYRKSKNINI